MRIGVMIVAAMLCGVGQSLAEEDAFVRQLSTKSAAMVQQGGNASGAFVGQLPLTAKPHVATVAHTRPHYVPRAFISQPAFNAVGDEPLVVDEDAGIIGYGEAPRPALPSIRAGVSVVLTLPGAAAQLPDIGAGAVVL